MGLRAKKSILLVDDETIIAAVQAEILRRVGFVVIIANSGEKAVQIAESDETVGLILMDIDPGREIDGAEAARQILEKRDLPILFLISRGERDNADRVRSIAHYGYVIKDSDDFVLQSSIEMAFELFEARQNSAMRMKTLHESEVRLLAHTLASIEDCVTIADLDDRVLFANDAFSRTYGYSREEIAGKPISIIGSPLSPDDPGSQILTASPEGRWNGEMINRKKDGSDFPVEIRASVVRNESGKPVAMVCVSRDITKRKRAEEALSHERNLLRTLIDNLPESVCIYIKDTESRYVVNNSAHLRTLGVTHQEDVAGKTLFDFFPAEQAKGFYADDQEVMRTGEPLVEREEISYDQTFGGERWHLTSKVPLRDSAGKVMGLVGMSTDITERKRMEEELIAREAQFRFIFESLPVGLSWNVPGRDETRIVNAEHVRITGVTAEQSKLPGSFARQTHPDDLSRQAALVAKVNSGEIDQFTMDKRYVHADGQTVGCGSPAAIIVMPAVV